MKQFLDGGRPPDSLVFSGGGFKGIAFVGALRSLKEGYGWDFGLRQPALKKIMGVSIGAFVAFLIIVGLSLDELLCFVRFCELGSLFNPNPVGGIFGGIMALDDSLTMRSKISQILKERLHMPTATLLELKNSTGISLLIGVTNLKKLTFECLGPDTHPDLDVCDAIIASMAIPPIFAPQKLPGQTLAIDGGITCNYPITEFKNAESVIGMRFISNPVPITNSASFSYFADIMDIIVTPLSEIQWAFTPFSFKQRTISILAPANGIFGMAEYDVLTANGIAARAELVSLGMAAGDEAVQAWHEGKSPKYAESASPWMSLIANPLHNAILLIKK
jgi:predicted acylesterase/phospholipase RssA